MSDVNELNFVFGHKSETLTEQKVVGWLINFCGSNILSLALESEDTHNAMDEAGALGTGIDI